VVDASPQHPARRRVLILDDERALLPLLERFLRKQGFDPASFEDVAPAVEAFRAGAPSFDLLMVDLTLKDGANGEDVARQLLAEDPRLRVLLMSGYPYSVENLTGDERLRAGFLQKPFLPSQIAEAVNAICPPPPPEPAVPAPPEAEPVSPTAAETTSSELPADDPQSSPPIPTTTDAAPAPAPHPRPE
jgi:DNA-binding NtrC family response regulator